MKLTAAREELLAPLQSVIGVVERRQTMPVARERAAGGTGQQTKRHGERSRGRAGRNLHGERAAAGRYHGARARISGKALTCELGGNRLPQVQLNAPARRRVPASLRLRTSLRDPAAVRGTKRDADTVRMLPRALWSRSRASCLLGRSSRRHSNQARFTRPRNNHLALT